MSRFSFAKLNDGNVHYQFTESGDGPIILLVHGVSCPMAIWDPIMDTLVAAGLRVLRFDLYGRGYSDSPNLPYTVDLFVRQIDALLDYLEITEPVYLLGISLGGGIAVTYSAERSEKVERLILIAPAGIPMPKIPLKLKLLRIRGLGDFMMKSMGRLLLQKSFRTQYLYNKEKSESFAEEFIFYYKKRNSLKGILSTYRDYPVDGLLDYYRKLSETSIPILLFWGNEDQLIPYDTHMKILKILPRAEFCSIENAGHGVHYDCPLLVSSRILKFIGFS